MKITAHIDGQHKTIEGVTFKNTHSGQKKAYGDSFYEYEIESPLPREEVERVCSTLIYKAIPKEQWEADGGFRASMDNHFRAHYTLAPTGEGRWFYQVMFPYAD